MSGAVEFGEEGDDDGVDEWGVFGVGGRVEGGLDGGEGGGDGCCGVEVEVEVMAVEESRKVVGWVEVVRSLWRAM